jgi:sugar lactone lactonase YvrE
MAEPFVTGVSPSRAIEGGRVTLAGDFGDAGLFPDVRIQGRPARTVFASPKQLAVIIPSGIFDGGFSSISLGEATSKQGLELGVTIATGLHQVDNPLIDQAGNVYLTYSGTRGQQGPVSIFRVAPNGSRETYSSAVVNPTSMAMDAEGRLYVSSRFEGAVYRLGDDGSAEPYATDLGIATGLAFSPDGSLFVGDRSGTIFSVDRSGKATVFASLPSSVAAFHLALGASGLYVAAPTLSPYDVIYHVGFDGAVSTYSRAFGRPQGIAVGPDGSLFVVEALAGASGLYRVTPDAAPQLVVAGTGLIGLAFGPRGSMVVCSSDTAYRFVALS